MKTWSSAITSFCFVACVCFIATWSVENADAATVESEVWAPLSVMRVTNPMNFGAVGNGAANDLPALTRAVDALGDGGGVVYLPPGRSFLKTAPLRISKSHIKLWSPNQQANIFGAIRAPNTQSVIFQNLQWGGLFGLRLRSNATSRGRTQLDHQVVSYNTVNFEVCGIEVNGSNAGGIFLHDGSSRMFVEGNVVRWTWADHIHHTGGVTWSWVWGNRLFNGLPSKGDDGVASVTYGTTNRRNRDLEWFENIVLGQTGARGYAVVGGDKVNIHHNWAISTQGAGIYIAAERGYNSSGSNDITINNNWLYRVAQNDTANHAGMMCFAGNRPDAPVQNVRFTNNVVVETKRGQAYRNPSGNVFNISNSNMVTDFSRLPTPMPTASDVKTKDTTVLRTRDTWFVGEQFRNGLYRIHVRVSPSNSSAFQQRFEYVVRGPVGVIRQLAQVHLARASSCVLAYRNDTNGASANLVVLSSVPLNVDRTTGAVGVTFEQLRTGDRNGQHSWLWDLLDDPQAQKGTQCLPRRTRDSDDTDDEFY